MRTRIWLGTLLAAAMLILPVGSAAQGATASLSVGSGSGFPGATGVAIPVTLGGGAEVVGLNFDITFDSSRLGIGSVTVGPAVPTSKSFSSSVLGGNTVRVIIFDMNPSPLLIPNGTVAIVSFNVLPSATAGTSPLSLSNVTAASPPPTTSVPVDTDDGSFEVLEPPATNTLTPTRTPTATSGPTRTRTPTGTSIGRTNTATPSQTAAPAATHTRTRTPVPSATWTSGGPTATASPTKTQTIAPTITRTLSVVATATQTPTSTVALSGQPTGTPELGADRAATQTAEAVVASTAFEAAVIGTATALAEFDTAVQATATALAEQNTGPSQEGGVVTVQPSIPLLLLVAAGGLALVILAAILAFILLRRRQ